jgi:hypothetical protein
MQFLEVAKAESAQVTPGRPAQIKEIRVMNNFFM